ncbi:hypothetical protein GCM10011512_08930 [Tersicoccus solisilvae]|uniref:DUF4381 domain-containing protein n=1 Tax=Tersicoccus solisilvae TaxID=1882339 RepID=A0ABQ1NTS0_9MICC|nr:hypothetical protein [Tersicoccus solisilvae]GGC84328.1 hypothetical protein GCM10011512_08930 [Tersicoccus solisilvae]
MNDGGRFYGPLPYEPVWLWIGLGLLAAVAAWYIWALASTRRSRKKWQVPGPEGLPGLQRDYLARIDAVAVAADRGELTARQAHQRLSRLVRVFAHQASGVSAHTMTLADLRELSGNSLSGSTTTGAPVSGASGASGVADVADAVAVLYPAEFGVPEAADARRAVDAAREVVSAWR